MVQQTCIKIVQYLALMVCAWVGLESVLAQADLDIEKIHAQLLLVPGHEGLTCNSKPLGSGTYGVVLSCLDGGNPIALKVSELFDVSGDGSVGSPVVVLSKESVREKFILEKTRGSQHLMYSLWSYANEDHLFIAMPLCSANLENLINLKKIPDRKINSVVKQVIWGLKEFHEMGLMHRDLKPANILICEGRIRIADFGASAQIAPVGLLGAPRQSVDYVDLGGGKGNSTPGRERTTRWYAPPDVLLGNRNYGVNLDYWSLGCVISFVKTGTALFPGDSEFDQLRRIFKTFGTPGIVGRNLQHPELLGFKHWANQFPLWAAPMDHSESAGVIKTDLDSLLHSLLQVQPSKRNYDGILDRIKLKAASKAFIDREQASWGRTPHFGLVFPKSAAIFLRHKARLVDYIFEVGSNSESEDHLPLVARILDLILDRNESLTPDVLKSLGLGAMSIARALNGQIIEIIELAGISKSETPAIRKAIALVLNEVQGVYPQMGTSEALIYSRYEASPGIQNRLMFYLDVLGMGRPLELAADTLVDSLVNIDRLFGRAKSDSTVNIVFELSHSQRNEGRFDLLVFERMTVNWKLLSENQSVLLSLTRRVSPGFFAVFERYLGEGYQGIDNSFSQEPDTKRMR